MNSALPSTDGADARTSAGGIPRRTRSNRSVGKHLWVVAISMLLAFVSALLLYQQSGAATSGTAPGGKVARCGGGKIFLYEKERRTFKRHNGIRRRHNLPTFCVHPDLERAARFHSEDMIRRDYFAHKTMGHDEGFGERVKSYGYSDSYLMAENLAHGAGSAGSPHRIMRAWMHSDGHRHNILNRKLCQVGIGVYVGNFKGHKNTSMYTVDFGAKRL